jgi:hypothetical protein
MSIVLAALAGIAALIAVPVVLTGRSNPKCSALTGLSCRMS